MNKPQITLDDISRNELSVICNHLALDIIMDAEKREGYDINKNNNHLFSDNEKYVLELFDILLNINNCLASIDYSCIFMKRFYGKDYYKKQQISIIDYSLYHYDAFCYKISTLKDLYFKIINHLYKLNLQKQACNWDNIKKRKSEINNPFLFDLLSRNYQDFSFIDKRRNKSAHEGKMEHKAFKNISPYVVLAMYADKGPSDISRDDIIARGSWVELKLKKSRKIFLEEIEICRYNAFIFTRCILCSLSDKFASTIDNDIRNKYSATIDKAIQVIIKNRNCVNNAHLNECPNG
ncbi:Cthe_2314 family HEPN domain-containing protein [uncultured Bacteroides sp.]|uniref:Cthe_2314 family HEPN domain-containing protein n=1 Tax=uncultured Bacteroides sp. TaxID=162156 RepID=UPI002AAC469B|nr:Cthe_2314 family HEPN domain-containing protein [uncultured Bacteroides sp.]